MQGISPYARSLAYICVWREMRSIPDAQQAVTWVILNRAMRWNDNLDEAIVHEITRPWAFSSMTAKSDPQLRIWPQHSTAFDTVAANVDAVLDGQVSDPTGGATFYFSMPLTAPPTEWGQVEKTLQIQSVQFYKVV